MAAITDEAPDLLAPTPTNQPPGAEVISLRSRTAELPERPLPSLEIYDQLLPRRQKGTTA